MQSSSHSIIFPSSIFITLPHCSATAKSWVTITIVFPCLFRSINTFIISFVVSVSSAPVGCVKLVQKRRTPAKLLPAGVLLFILSCAVLAGVFSHLSTRTVFARTSGSFPVAPCSHQSSSRTSDKIHPPALCLGSISQVCFLPSAFPPYLLYMIVTYFLANSQTAS